MLPFGLVRAFSCLKSEEWDLWWVLLKGTAVGALCIRGVLLVFRESGQKRLCGVRVSPSLGQKCELQGSVSGRQGF